MKKVISEKRLTKNKSYTSAVRSIQNTVQKAQYHIYIIEMKKFLKAFGFHSLLHFREFLL